MSVNNLFCRKFASVYRKVGTSNFLLTTTLQ